MTDYQWNETSEAGSPLVSPSLPIFLDWIKDRVSHGASLVLIGSELGVTGATVSRWLAGKRRVPRMALLLGERIRAESAGNPREMAAGLPIGLPTPRG